MHKFGRSKPACSPMSRENQLLVTDEPVEFHKEPAEVEDFRKFIDHLEESREYYTSK